MRTEKLEGIKRRIASEKRKDAELPKKLGRPPKPKKDLDDDLNSDTSIKKDAKVVRVRVENKNVNVGS